MSISGLATELIRKRINAIMKAVNPKYSGKANNYWDGIRVYQAYRRKMVVKSNERNLLILNMLFNILSHITLLILIVVLVFGPGIMNILNP